MSVDPLIGMTIDFGTATPAPEEAAAPRGGNGSQVLPVADLGDDYEGEPEDGLQYLFTVRREAATHPTINRAAGYDQNNPRDQVLERVAVEAPLDRPTEAWRTAFLLKFQGLRERMEACPPFSSFPAPAHLPPPYSRNEAAWRLYIYGKRQVQDKQESQAPTVELGLVAQNNRWNMSLEDSGLGMTDKEILDRAKAMALAALELDAPEIESLSISEATGTTIASTEEETYEIPPQRVSTSLLLDLDTTTILDVLAHFNTWFTEQLEEYDLLVNDTPLPAVIKTPPTATAILLSPLPIQHEAQWIMSLFTVLDSLLPGDDISNLRCLAKTLLEMSALAEVGAQAVKGLVGRSAPERKADEEVAEGQAACWMIVAIIAKVYGQGDLWNGDI